MSKNRQVLDPYGGGSSAIVDKMLGNSYYVVRQVAQGLSHIKHVSHHLKNVFDVSQNIKGIRFISENIEVIERIGELQRELEKIFEFIDPIISVSLRLDEIVQVRDAIPTLIDLNNNSDVFQDIHQNLQDLVAVAGSLQAIIQVSESLGNIQTLLDNIDEITELSNKIPELNDIQNSLTQLLAIHEKLPELLTVHTNLAQIIEVSENMDELVSIANNLQAILDVEDELQLIKVVSDNLPQIIAVEGKLPEITSVSGSLDAITGVYDKLAELQEIYDNLTKLLNILPVPTVDDAGKEVRVNAAGTGYGLFEKTQETPQADAGTLILRHPNNGRAQIVAPLQPMDITNKEYVDAGGMFFSISGLDIRAENQRTIYSKYRIEESGELRVNFAEFLNLPKVQPGHFIKISSVIPTPGETGPSTGIYQVRKVITNPLAPVVDVYSLNYTFITGPASGDCEIQVLDLEDVVHNYGVSFVTLASTGIIIVNPSNPLPLNNLPPPGILLGYNHRTAIGSARPTSGSAWLQVMSEPIGLTEPFKAANTEDFVLGSSKIIAATGAGTPAASPSLSVVGYRS